MIITKPIAMVALGVLKKFRKGNFGDFKNIPKIY